MGVSCLVSVVHIYLLLRGSIDQRPIFKRSLSLSLYLSVWPSIYHKSIDVSLTASPSVFMLALVCSCATLSAADEVLFLFFSMPPGCVSETYRAPFVYGTSSRRCVWCEVAISVLLWNAVPFMCKRLYAFQRLCPVTVSQ